MRLTRLSLSSFRNFARLEAESLATLESHARQIVTLSTSLLAAFLGLLSLVERPAFLALPAAQGLAALALGAFFAALLFALDALTPRRHTLPRHDLTAKRQALDALLRRKQNAGRRATYAFALGALLMLATALVALVG